MEKRRRLKNATTMEDIVKKRTERQPKDAFEPVRITYYTDPLCLSSWAMQREWSCLLKKWQEMVDVGYKMNGLLLKSRRKADYPLSSVPACIAVKCMEFQSPQLSGLYLRLLREAHMLGHLNITQPKVLVTVASGLSRQYPAFDLIRFRNELFFEKALLAFEKDVEDASFFGVDCSPTLFFTASDGNTERLTGFNSFQVMDNLVSDIYCIREAR
jgi:putative protein-disulfide isomerase